ncbi:MAG: FHA domain-containing protein [Archangium sp.]|nr:FHA domain-containing protein [Archangium sp.]
MLKLIIEDDEGRKTVVPFVRDEITIGRQEGNTIRLTERNVSRRHARLMRNNGHVLIEDLGSYNGIRINGDRISGQVQVADGDLIQIGDYDLALQAEEGKQASAPTVPLEPATTRKLPVESSATMPALPAVESPQEAADEDVRDAEEGEVGSDVAAPVPKHQATAVIRIDQIEGNRKRTVAEIDVAEAPRLVVLNTDFAGREFVCNRTEMKIGRTDDNDIAIDHRSLSRTHCKVVREESGEWRVVDMQSANGLMVNGESYAQVTLRPGDVIELGHVKLKFVGPGEQVNIPPSSSSNVTAEANTAAASKTPLIAVAVALLVVILGGGGYMLYKSGQDPVPLPKDKPPKDPIAVKNPVQDPPKADAEALKKAALEKLDEAKEGAAALDFNKAEVLAKEATVDGALLPEAKTFLAALESEKPNRVALEQAAKLLDSGALEKAKTQLDSASGTRLLRARYDLLDSRRAKMVADKVAAKDPPKVETPVKVETPKDPPKVEVVKAPPAGNDARTAEAEALFKDASEEKKAKNYERALVRLEKCLKVSPKYHPCYRLLGSVYASIATRDQSAGDMEKARRWYERFVEVAPPDDDYVPKVKAILDAAKQNQ